LREQFLFVVNNFREGELVGILGHDGFTRGRIIGSFGMIIIVEPIEHVNGYRDNLPVYPHQIVKIPSEGGRRTKRSRKSRRKSTRSRKSRRRYAK